MALLVLVSLLSLMSPHLSAALYLNFVLHVIAILSEGCCLNNTVQ